MALVRITSTERNFKASGKQSPDPSIAKVRPKIVIINNEEEYEDFISQDDRLCLIKFHASWCKSCKMFGKQFERIGKNIGDLETKDSSLVKEGEIRLGQIEFGANTKLCKKLGVKKVPSLHFYSESKKVDGFPCGPKKISHTLERLNHYRSLSLSELSFEADMNKGKALGEDMLKEASTSDKKKKRRIF